MGYSSTDAAWDAAAADQEDTALAEALQVARGVCESFVHAHEGHRLDPLASVELGVGGDDQPLFVFSLLLQLEDDFDAEEYPTHDVDELLSELRGLIADTSVDDWDWLVTTGTRTGATRR